MAASEVTKHVAGVLLAVLSVTTLPVLGSIPAGLTTPESFAQALLDRYGSGTGLTVQELQVLLRNASSCPGLQPCGATGQAAEGAAQPGEGRCNNTCLTAEEVLQIHNLPNTTVLNAARLREVSTTILYTVDHTTGCLNTGGSSSEETGGDHHDEERPRPGEVWGFGILSVAVISLCSVVGVLVVPFKKKQLYTLLLTFLIGLAVGALSGSALFHLIPHAFDLHEGLYTEKAAAVWAGIYLFFITERLMKIASKRRQKRKAQKYAEQNGNVDVMTNVAAVCALTGYRTKSHSDPLTEAPQRRGHCHSHGCNNRELVASLENGGPEELQDQKGSCCGSLFSNADTVKTVAWMVIFGDGLHNLMDGLAIGASFQVSVFSGITTSVAILCEELPHELGDFAILLNAGMSVQQAMFYNFLSACSCFIGLFIGILAGQDHLVGQWIFAVTGGMFLYISLVDMLPEMNAVDEDEEEKEDSDQDGGTKKPSFLLRFLLQNLGLLTGFAAMFLLAKFHIGGGHHGHGH